MYKTRWMDEWFMVQEGDFATDVAVESADGNLNALRKMDADQTGYSTRAVGWCCWADAGLVELG